MNAPLHEIIWRLLALGSYSAPRLSENSDLCEPLRKGSHVEAQGWDDTNGTTNHSACLGPHVTVWRSTREILVQTNFVLACSEA